MIKLSEFSADGTSTPVYINPQQIRAIKVSVATVYHNTPEGKPLFLDGGLRKMTKESMTYVYYGIGTTEDSGYFTVIETPEQILKLAGPYL